MSLRGVEDNNWQLDLVCGEKTQNILRKKRDKVNIRHCISPSVQWPGGSNKPHHNGNPKTESRREPRHVGWPDTQYNVVIPHNGSDLDRIRTIYASVQNKCGSSTGYVHTPPNVFEEARVRSCLILCTQSLKNK